MSHLESKSREEADSQGRSIISGKKIVQEKDLLDISTKPQNKKKKRRKKIFI